MIVQLNTQHLIQAHRQVSDLSLSRFYPSSYILKFAVLNYSSYTIESKQSTGPGQEDVVDNGPNVLAISMIGLVVKFGSSFYFILTTVVLGGSIGAGIAPRGICDISEQKYCWYAIDLVCDFGYCSRFWYFVRSVAINSVFSTSTFPWIQASYLIFELQLLLAILYYNTIVNVRNNAGRNLKYA